MSYRFTDGQKLNSDEIEPVFCNLTSKVTAENYSTMVSQGLYLETSIPIANTTEMIKFRYYNPSHALIEQENVPIVLDGNGVKTHTVYTALSTTANKPDSASFSTTVKNVSSVNKYLWQYEVTEYTNGTIEGGYADAKIIGVYGDKGETGSRGGIYLGCFATNAQDNSPDMSSSIVFVENDYYLSSSDGYIYLYTNSAWNAITNYTDSRYFEAVNDALGNGLVSDTTQNIVKAVNAWTQNLVAGTALINKLFAKEMTMENGGVFKSQNYNGTITTTTDSEGNVTDRVLTKNGTVGFAMDSHGNLDVVSGNFRNCNIKNSLEFPDSTATTYEYDEYGSPIQKSVGIQANGDVVFSKVNANNLTIGGSFTSPTGIFLTKQQLEITGETAPWLKTSDSSGKIHITEPYWGTSFQKLLIIPNGGYIPVELLINNVEPSVSYMKYTAGNTEGGTSLSNWNFTVTMTTFRCICPPEIDIITSLPNTTFEIIYYNCGNDYLHWL